MRHDLRSRREAVACAAIAGPLLAVGVLLSGCEPIAEVSGPELEPAALSAAGNAITARASGGGHFVDSWLTETTWRFAFAAVQWDPQSREAHGNFLFTTSFAGEPVAIYARVTCMNVDPEHRRAWIGGVITQNRSEHPWWRDDPRTQVGKPTFFRVVDNGEGANALRDRTSRNFFEGDGGHEDEWAFCTRVPPFWPVIDGVERFTDGLSGGNIEVE